MWQPKTPTEMVERRWTVPVAYGDAILSASTSASDVMVDSDSIDGGDVVVVLSGGSAGAVASVTITAVTSNDETLVETFYIAIQDPAALTATVRDVVDFALRPIVGMGEVAEAAELADGVEQLNDMLASWRVTGVILPVSLPLAAADTLYLSDGALRAIKASLRVVTCEQYGKPVDQVSMINARLGFAQLRQASLPNERVGADYF